MFQWEIKAKLSRWLRSVKVPLFLGLAVLYIISSMLLSEYFFKIWENYWINQRVTEANRYISYLAGEISTGENSSGEVIIAPGSEFQSLSKIYSYMRVMILDSKAKVVQDTTQSRIGRYIVNDEVIKALRPGVTELSMVGIAERVIYENGAEYEGLPMYVFSEASTRHAISRSSYRVIEKGDIVQLNLSAKIDGYSPSTGLPVVMGKITADRRRYIDFCFEMHKWTVDNLKAGIPAWKIPQEFYKKYIDAGYKDSFVYGPCHSTGMIEVEAPWMETTSDWILEENMTFQVDTFISGPTFGTRWEKGVVITKDGCDSMTDYLEKGLIELDF